MKYVRKRKTNTVHEQYSFLGGTGLENLPANKGDVRDSSSIPKLGRSPGVENGNPLLYSCLENSMDKRAWGATVHGVAKLDTTEQALVQAYEHIYMGKNR